MRALRPLFLFLLTATAIANAGCLGCTNIEPGHVGVMIKKCSGGGVDPKPLAVGWQFRSIFCEEIVEYPTYQQTLILTKAEHEGQPIDDSIWVNSNEGLPINVDCSVNFTLDGAKVPGIYMKYRNDIDHITHSYVKQTVREGLQEISAKYTAEQLYSTKRGDARSEVHKFLQDKLGVDGFNITQFTINALRPPKQVTDAIEAKVAMVQQAMKSEQEVRKIEAEAKQKVARTHGDAEARRAMADAEAYYNKTVSSSITPQLVQMQQIQAQVTAISKWDGKMPTMTGGTVPFIQMSGK